MQCKKITGSSDNSSGPCVDFPIPVITKSRLNLAAEIIDIFLGRDRGVGSVLMAYALQGVKRQPIGCSTLNPAIRL